MAISGDAGLTRSYQDDRHHPAQIPGTLSLTTRLPRITEVSPLSEGALHVEAISWPTTPPGEAAQAGPSRRVPAGITIMINIIIIIVTITFIP